MIWNLISWYFVVSLLGWLTFPLTYHLFNKLPDRGYTLSRILGLLLWGFGHWLLGSLGLTQNHPGGILFALFIVTLISAWRGIKYRAEIIQWVRINWRLIIMAELVFLIFFSFMVLVRASNPDATGTEKPMELAFINAIIKADALPPHDPWLSGYAISYYHFGYIITAILAKVTAVPGSIAFNLMISLVFGLSAVGSYGILYNWLSVFRNGDKPSRSEYGWALVGPVFLLFISNLVVVLEMLYQAGIGWDLAWETSAFWQWVNIDSFRVPPSLPLSVVPRRFWWWWQSSRVIHDIDLLGNVSGLSPIDEFPAFSFVLGDLHPHVLVIPFVMLVVGLSFNIILGGMKPGSNISDTLKLPYRFDFFMVSAITLGGITFLNTWDLPVYFSLFIGSYLLWRIREAGLSWQRINEIIILALPLLLVSMLLYTPFLVSFQSQAGGILPNLVYPTRGLYLWLMFAPLFVPLILFFIWLYHRNDRANWSLGFLLVGGLILGLYLLSLLLGYRLIQSPGGEQIIFSQGAASYINLIWAALGHRLQFGMGLLTLFFMLAGPVALMLGRIMKPDHFTSYDSSIWFVLWMIILGGIVVLAPEFVYLQDNFGTRMNTVFKFYYQAWMLWSLAAAFAAVIILRKSGIIGRVIIISMIVLGLIFPIFAFPDKTNGFRPSTGYTLDAGAYLIRTQPNEAAAISWLSDAPIGVVAEAVGGQYTGFARVSTHSGQPAVLGWPGHQGQWRGGYDEVGSRETDIRILYETGSWQATLEIIQLYDIRYIYIGSLEMNSYVVSQGKFEQNLGLAFEQGGVRIYDATSLINIGSW